MKKIILILVIIGALNWGFIGFFGYDVVSYNLGPNLEVVSRIIFAIVGLAGLYSISFLFREKIIMPYRKLHTLYVQLPFWLF